MAANRPNNRATLVLQMLFLVILCAVLAAVAIGSGMFETETTSRSITYRVSGSAGFAEITYRDGNQKVVAVGQVTVPWETTIWVEEGTEVYLTAANPSQLGEIACEILLDRKSWKKEQVRSPLANVACGGIVP